MMLHYLSDGEPRSPVFCMHQQAEVADGDERTWMLTAERLVLRLQRIVEQRLSSGAVRRPH